MTALMVLFLVAMAVALHGQLTEGLEQIKRIEKDRTDTIRSCVNDIRSLTSAPEFKGVVVKDSSIEFGPLAEFRHDGNDLNESQQKFLRQFVPKVLQVATHKSLPKAWPRVVVDGYASQEGCCICNLNLSFKRFSAHSCAFSSTPRALWPWTWSSVSNSLPVFPRGRPRLCLRRCSAVRKAGVSSFVWSSGSPTQKQAGLTRRRAPTSGGTRMQGAPRIQNEGQRTSSP